MSPSRIVITGPIGVAPRLEINDFIKDDKFFTLYIRALQRMQRTDESEDKSFFGVASIHGQPYTVWNGAKGLFTTEKWNFGGYCTHGSVLFPTWHRPYLSLFEQIIQEHAIEIVEEFAFDQGRWRKAALDLRQPFWDWAMNAVPPDCVIKDEMVTITGFDGERILVENPLVRYRLQSQRSHDSFSVPFNKWTTTLRHPNVHGKENIGKLVQTLVNAQTQITDDTVALLAWTHDWSHLSNHSAQEGTRTNSLEAIHDHIHVHIGGGGHMSETAVAAFDPIFYLHHSNLDRILTAWSFINGGKWVTEGKNDADGTFTLPPQTMLDENTDLAPFWNSNSNETFWKSRQLIDMEKFGYTYPEFERIRKHDSNALKDAAEDIICRYIEKFPGGISTTGDAKVDHWWNWIIRVRAKKYELGRSFSVLIFLDGVPRDSRHWLSSDAFVGAHHVFTNGTAERCENCRINRGIVSEGFVHLNRRLRRTWPGTSTFDIEIVRPYLLEELQWRVTDAGGWPVHIDSLEIAIIGVPLSKPQGAILPAVNSRQVEFYHEIELGRRRGARRQSGA
ncbi:hypothetical protein AX17_002627 [Amanita inopinata Kibby_2008]|nr:hypothetical protein AX17_002627 [Amanita inopinata Kibby_2008]